MLLAASLCRGAVCSGGRVGCKSGEQSPRRLGLGAVADRSLITLFALICRGVWCSSIVSISKFEICDLEGSLHSLVHGESQMRIRDRLVKS